MLANLPLRYKEYLRQEYSIPTELISVVEKGGSLYLYGKVGSGKTYTAVKLSEYIKPKHKYSHQTGKAKGIFINADEMFHQLSIPENKPVIFGKLQNYDYIILDDLSLGNWTPAKQESLFVIINKVYVLKQQIIITSNYSPKGIENLDNRITSRLSEIGKFFEFKTERRKKWQ